MRIKYFVIIALALNAALFSCKKPENGEKITLTTKKHRITERWTMIRGNVGISQYVNGSIYNSNFELTQGQGHLTQTGTFIIYSHTYNLYMELAKDGKFSVSEDFNGETMSCHGTWDFNKKNSKEKAKEEIVLQLTNVTSGNIDDHLFNHFVNGLSYKIKVLSKDDLTMSANTTYYYNGTEKWVIQSEYTFKRQH
jgi:hypothetical protein